MGEKDYVPSSDIELNPNDAQAHNNRGIAYAGKGDCDNAIRDFTKAIELDPKLAEAMANMGLVYVKKGDTDNARQWWKKALEKKEYLTGSGEAIVRQWLKSLEE